MFGTRAQTFVVVSLIVLGVLPVRAAERPSSPVEFNRDIRPILSDTCFACHGPDESKRKAKLRLDTKEGALAALEDGQFVIKPGDLSRSEVYRRITAKSPDDLMPPPDSHLALTPAQIELIRRWIAQGAEWVKHWAFVPPADVRPPGVKDARWPRNAIDHFIAARLEQEGLRPTPEATRERLIRRVSFDLTGLPSTPAEIDAFVADKSPDACEKLVDRLLASPRFGERMASEWLDLARYADTHGYQNDRYRSMWPYRDWVIGAFNRNLPFDQFVTWQIAGDLLPNATQEQRLATAFNRLHMQNEEGGIVEEEFRVAYVVDRVNTFGTAFLGLTMECTRCHDHKYDPVTMRDYYSLFSFFQNIDESGQTVYFGEVMPVPTLLLSTDKQDAKLASLKQKIGEQERQLPTLRAAAREPFAGWLETKTNLSGLAGLVGAFDFDEVVSNRIVNLADAAKPAHIADHVELVPGHRGKAAALDGENGFTFPGLGHFTRSDPFTFGLWLRTASLAPRQVVLHHSRAWMDAGSRGYELVLEDGKIAVGLHHMWPGNSIKVRTQATLTTNEWTHVAFTYNGSSRAEGLTIFLNGRPAAVEVIRDGLWKDISYGGGEPDLAIGHRFRDSGFKGGRVDELRIFNRALTSLEVADLAGRGDLTNAWQTPAAQLSAATRAGLFEYFFANVHAPMRQWAAELHALRTEQRQAIEPIPEAMVMQEMAQPKPAHILKRGAYDAPGERVALETPPSLPPFPVGAPRNRLGLTRWLLAPDHPLMARVTVNRAWQQMFGRGIVETSDNLGSQGAPPTHPELLDRLARDFIRSGWDYKKLLRQIALSATYRQASGPVAGNPSMNANVWAANAAKDPDNRFLWHAPARRLTAEMLRDQALAVSGLLVEKPGGPSVKPYQPAGLWEIAMGNPRYEPGKGDDLHRRSLYTFWKRTVPPPSLMTFDAADRSNCAARRQSTSTPLQALALLNDTQIVEAARHVGQRLLKEGGHSLTDQVAWTFRLVTGRTATAKEVAVLEQLYSEQREIFTNDPAAAQKLLAVGEAKNDGALPPASLAAGTVLAKALLNHDEAVLRR